MQIVEELESRGFELVLRGTLVAVKGLTYNDVETCNYIRQNKPKIMEELWEREAMKANVTRKLSGCETCAAFVGRKCTAGLQAGPGKFCGYHVGRFKQ